MRVHPTSSVQSSSDKSLWNYIWKAEVPGKVKLCVWKACRNILPTHSNLEKKGVALNNTCVFCSSSLELALHVSIACSFAQTVFLSSKLPLGPRMAGSHLFSDWFSHCAESLPLGGRLIFF